MPKAELEHSPEVFTSLITHHLPDIKDWLQGNAVTRQYNPFLAEKDGDYSFDSGEITMNGYVWKGIDTKGNIKIHITYFISKDKK